MKIGAIIQARTGSTRLPNKVLLPLPYNHKTTVLQQVIRRVKKTVPYIIVATTTLKTDKKIEIIANQEKVNIYRGSETNVLKRFYNAAHQHTLDVIVRITSDCPCIDPSLIKEVIGSHLQNKADYTSNVLDRHYPRGMDIEVFNFSTLKKAYVLAKDDYDKEHVTPYIHKNKKIFSLNSYIGNSEKSDHIRITLDTKQDYALICMIFEYLYPKNHNFGLDQILKLIKEKPWLLYINQSIEQKREFKNLNEELTVLNQCINIHGLNRVAKILKKKLSLL